MSGFFVTGTDTGVGKTVLVAAMCVTLDAVPMKPVQTGSLESDDVAFVESVTGRVVPSSLATPYRFGEPLAPKVAARRAGATIDLARIVRDYNALAGMGPVVVEGAGGLLVELAESVTMADLARELELPVVVACRPGLGTLNHSELTVEAAHARGLEVAGLVIVGWPAEPDLAMRTNPAELSRLAPIVGCIPRLAGLDTEARRAGELRAEASRSLAPVLGGTFDAASFLATL